MGRFTALEPVEAEIDVIQPEPMRTQPIDRQPTDSIARITPPRVMSRIAATATT